MNAGGKQSSLKSSARELVLRAAEAGIENAHRITALSPREIELQMKAIAARRRAEGQRMDLLAWRIGRYVLSAVHAPRRYPKHPDEFQKNSAAMSDLDMKRAFLSMAARKEEQHGDN